MREFRIIDAMRFTIGPMKVTMIDDPKYQSNQTEILFLAASLHRVSSLHFIQRLRSICHIGERSSHLPEIVFNDHIYIQ